MDYQEALNWIHGRLKFGIKPGLERMAWMLQELGKPQEKIAAVHVVGTNGKGSVVNNLQHIFTQSGYEVGTFTSPYIVDFRERISLNGKMMSEQDLVACVTMVKPIVERLSRETQLEAATEFEVISLIMFLYFGKLHPVDIAIIEAGMGGRDDSTNLFHALAVVCPSIGLDHQAVLGQTYKEIAEQKAGVLKDSEPLIFAVQDSRARQAFLKQARKTHSPSYEFEKDFTLLAKEGELTFQSKRKEISHIQLAMPGKHQHSNAALAIQTALLLQEKYPKVNSANIRQALLESKWVGRTELMADNLMIDGAHNKESIKALVDLLTEDYHDKKIHFLFAAINTKPVASMLEELATLGDVTVTTFTYPSSLTLEDYPKDYKQVADFQTWLTRDYRVDSDDFYVVTGSLYFISQVREWLLKTQNN